MKSRVHTGGRCSVGEAFDRVRRSLDAGELMFDPLLDHASRRPGLPGSLVEDGDSEALTAYMRWMREVEEECGRIERLAARGEALRARLADRLPELMARAEGVPTCDFCGVAGQRLKKGLCPRHYISWHRWHSQPTNAGAGVEVWMAWRHERREGAAC